VQGKSLETDLEGTAELGEPEEVPELLGHPIIALPNPN
jgi:hypothetical protein